MYDLIRNFIEIGPWLMIAGGGLIGALVLQFGFVNIPGRKIISFVLVLVAAYAGGVVSGKDVTGRKLAAAEEVIRFLQEQNRLQAQQARVLSEQALERAETNQRLALTIAEYERELENGQTSRCASDPVYNNRLRTILEQLPGN